jgi:hypothetical protein
MRTPGKRRTRLVVDASGNLTGSGLPCGCLAHHERIPRHPVGDDMFVAHASPAYIRASIARPGLTRSPITHAVNSGATWAARAFGRQWPHCCRSHHSSPHVCRVLHDDVRPRRTDARSPARFHSMKRAPSRRDARMVLRLQPRVTLHAEHHEPGRSSPHVFGRLIRAGTAAP